DIVVQGGRPLHAHWLSFIARRCQLMWLRVQTFEAHRFACRAGPKTTNVGAAFRPARALNLALAVFQSCYSALPHSFLSLPIPTAAGEKLALNTSASRYPVDSPSSTLIPAR
ncbi:unnamed protein product, partial [Scytosiphon promiscuus]